jgi:hypothetical protein
MTESIFDQQCADLCEALALPQHQAAKATVRRAVIESAQALIRLARKHGVQTVQTEIAGSVVAAGQLISGKLDHVWENPGAVIDFKWGKGRQVDKQKNGTAIQLAAYAAMQAAEGRSATTAYLVLQNQQILSEPGGLLAGDAHMQGIRTSAETWAATVDSLVRIREAMSQGRLEALGAVSDEPAAGSLPVTPPCEYCGLQVLCGREGGR